jgi:hypothetical protein
MDERVALVAVLLITGTGVATPLATASSAPSVAVTADGLPLDRGDVHRTATDPWIRVSASAADPITLVEVRIDGETRHVIEPDDETVARNVVLDLETGRHNLTVVARAGDVATYDATLVRDDAAPVINYTSPFPADATPEGPETPPTTELTVSRSNVSVNATLSDHSRVTAVRIDHRYDYRGPDEGSADREGYDQHLIEVPGSGFDQSLLLAPGGNEVTIRAEDAVGNVRTHDVTVTVEDDTAPALTLTDVEWVSPTRLHVEGRASDAVQVQSVWLESENETDESRSTVDGDRHPLVFPTTTAPDGDRRTVALDTTVYHPPTTDYVVIGANDTAGNERTWNYSLSRFLAPNVTVADRRTGYVDGRTVAVGGRVTGGQVRSVSAETVDPDTGRIVDVRPVDLAADDTFGVRLDGAAGETRVRVRVRDASGAEHVRNATVSEPAPAPATPSGAGGDDATGTASAAASTVRLPVVGVVPVPAVGVPDPFAPVSASLPLVGSVSVPAVAVGTPLAVVVLGVLIARRR